MRIVKWFPLLFFTAISSVILLILYPNIITNHIGISILFVIFFIVIIISLLLLLNYVRQTYQSNKAKSINLSIGHIHFSHEEEVRPIINVRFLGVSLRIIHSGKFTKIIISTD
jgi:hypothetical protein